VLKSIMRIEGALIEGSTHACIRNMDMAPETKNLIGNFFFESSNHSGSNDHYS